MTSEAGSTDIQDRLVAVADVLGFSHRMSTAPPETVAHQHRKLATLWREFVGVLNRGEPDTLVETLAFSDTIVWSIPLGHPRSGRAVSSLVQGLGAMVTTGIVENSAVRVAIAQGPCIIDPEANLIVGKPFVDAHDLQATCQWSGIAVHRSAFPTLRHECEESLVLEAMYPVPKKRPDPACVGSPAACVGSIDWVWDLIGSQDGVWEDVVKEAAITAQRHASEALQAYRAKPNDEYLSRYAKWLNTVHYIEYCSVEPSQRPRLGAQP